MEMDSCTETVTEDGKLVLHLTYRAFIEKVGEDKSVKFLQEQNKKILNGLPHYYMEYGWIGYVNFLSIHATLVLEKFTAQHLCRTDTVENVSF